MSDDGYRESRWDGEEEDARQLLREKRPSAQYGEPMKERTGEPDDELRTRSIDPGPLPFPRPVSEKAVSVPRRRYRPEK
jgi:hypothetical protein